MRGGGIFEEVHFECGARVRLAKSMDIKGAESRLENKTLKQRVADPGGS